MSVATRDGVGIVDDEFADPGFEQGDGDGAARAAGAEEQDPRSVWLGSVVVLCFHEGESVEHVAVPGAVGLRRMTLTTLSSVARSSWSRSGRRR